MSHLKDLRDRGAGLLQKSKDWAGAHKVICATVTLPFIISVAILRDIATQDSIPEKSAATVFAKADEGAATTNSQGLSFKQYLASQDEDKKKKGTGLKGATSTLIRSKPQVISRPLTRDLPLGAESSAVLLTGAGTGPVKAKLTESLRHRSEALFPEGTILLGAAQIINRRIQVQFSKAIIGDDEVINISATALDGGDKAPGLKAPWLEERGLEIAATMGGSLLESTAAILQERETAGPFGMQVRKPTFKNAAIGAAGDTAKKESDYYLEGMREQAKNFSVPAGTKIQILFESGE